MLRFIPDVDRSMSSYPSRFTHRRAFGWVAFIVTFLTCSYVSASTDEDWKIAEQIVNQIQLPTIPNEKFVVKLDSLSKCVKRVVQQSHVTRSLRQAPQTLTTSLGVATRLGMFCSSE